MARFTERELTNLHSQRSPPNPNPPFLNPISQSHPVVSNANYNARPPIYPFHPFSNPHHFPIFDPTRNTVYPSVPVLNHDHGRSAHILNYDHASAVSAMRNSDSNNRLGRVPLGVQGMKLKNKNNKGRKGVGWNEEPKKWPPISENEWLRSSIPEPAVKWPELNLKPAVERVLTDEENARFVASKSQQKALDAAREMFRARMDSDGEVEDYVSSGDDDDDEDDDDDVGDGDECEEYKFFSRVFAEDRDLRCYYEKNCEGGEFSCLVCVGIGKVGKKFKDCVALVQHSITIAKTKKRQAHRAFGKVICKVLGWEIQDLQGHHPHVHRTVKDGPHVHRKVKDCERRSHVH